MIFFVLNLILTLFFIAETVYIDKKNSLYDDGTNPIISNVLLAAVLVGLFTLFSFTGSSLAPGLFSTLMKVCFLLEGCLLINIAFCFPYYAWKYTTSFMLFLKYFLYLSVFVLVFFTFKEVTVDLKSGIQIRSAYIFKGNAAKYFPWTWVTVYNFVFRFLIPGFSCLVMLIRNEMNAIKLDKFKGSVYALGLISMWIFSLMIEFSKQYSRSFELLHYIIYLPMLVIMPYGGRVTTAPSGKGIFAFIIKAVSSFLIPAVISGVIFGLLYPLFGEKYVVLFCLCGVVISILILIFVNLINNVIKKSKFGRSSDYAVAFEKDLASVDYNGEMDEIAENMFHIFNKNTEASSMSIYINGGNDTFEQAYSSNNSIKKISNKSALFESLLNINKNIVVFSELETMHSLAPFKAELQSFFELTNADALFILNEGRDVHGIIVLGIKESGDHFKEYDMSVFNKLYSYFFVFGYYMRNISNKEIIGTVNRELRMSSQIITSIQENIDVVKNPKMDAGCVMIPAHNIGGEFVDMIRLTDNRHLFVLGDLSGKGIAASMSMVILKAIIRAFLAETHDFKQLIVKVNSFIRFNLQKGTIFSGMFAIVDFEKDVMYYINCGIPAILLYTEAYNNVIEIQGGGHILGFVKDISPYISVKQIKLNKNDIVLACTDGLIESHSIRGEEFGKDRIQRNMVANAMYPAQRMAQFQYDELMKFMSHEMEDDVSVLVMKYLNSNESEKEDSEANKTDVSNPEEEVPQNSSDENATFSKEL